MALSPPSRPAPALPGAWRLLFLAALAVALLGLLAPASTLLELKVWVSAWLPWAGELDRADALQHADKWVHAAIFLTLALLGLRAWPLARQRRHMLLGLVALAVATEWLQHYIPGRSASLGDFAADLAGLLLGALAFARLLPHPPALRQRLS
ncbi:MAG TPA: VanZ family protein [Ottowia sp.]|uniref:VanZ family protein n=1 Tax=Ottowia sp. TaxID=1898956 RepID=UPI002B958518|nr:VanZ family protein [Ottowia sp.]HMN20910.1 VanZ family protein [Ottowia sp.]